MRPQTESSLARWTLIAAGISGAVAVMIGAFGAHYLEDWLLHRGLAVATAARWLEVADTAVRYHLIHTVALLALFPLASWYPSRLLRSAVVLMVIGIVLFSGSLYLLVLLNETIFGMITPLGGLAWVAAWVLIAIAGARLPPSPSPP